jgi:hypothetical protein
LHGHAEQLNILSLAQVFRLSKCDFTLAGACPDADIGIRRAAA